MLFGSVKSGYGVEVLDRIDRNRYLLWTADTVAPEAVAPNHFSFPVDAAISVATEGITLPTVVPVCVRDGAGSFITSIEQSASETLSEGVYSLELAAPIKLYLRVDSPVTVSSNLMQTYIHFSDETEVLIGARSLHEEPAATITTTDDPRDMIAAVSTFASALKTQSPERSFPSNRGHPPMVERGEKLHIPAGMETPDASIRLEIPPDYRSIYAAAPLVYYLGADLVPADTPRLVTETGFEYALAEERCFEETLERVLKRVFFLDCVVRTEGMHPVDLYERQKVEEGIDHDLTSLYSCPPAERIEAYFDVPFSVLEPQMPDWKVTAHIEPNPKNVEMLPFIAHRLAVVRTSRGNEISPPNEQKAIINEYLRNDSTTSNEQTVTTTGSYVQPKRTDSLEEIWIGGGIPLGANKALLEAYQNRIGRQPTESDIEITIVYNDIDLSSSLVDVETSMNAERDVVDNVYGSRSDLPFDTTIHQDLTVDELRSILRTSTDFLHYIGHIDNEGMRCVDGKLDTATVESVGADAFFLNACQSYRQGYHLIRGGSIGGIATLGDLVNSEAIKMGQTIARLLNRGFPLYAAHEIARDVTLLGGQYVVLGDGGFAITQTESGVANLCEIESIDGEYFGIDIKTYPTARRGMGTIFIPYIKSNNEYFLSGGSLSSFRLSIDELQRFFELEEIPVRINEELRWSHDIDVTTL
ncbi:hypothetical protein CV102_22260 [Natronococcus pandeyae]|uniref:Uncharacterized protein n=1 Tax=Natronococcus pandeyae TaxID=2055836 RepID=A0A8J8PY20_9EURY|nr:hypothetical protein CV102_22260 [Natronococcus pandeyae]